MKRTLLYLLVLLLTFGCNKTDIQPEITPNPKKISSYKISLDSLKKQAVELHDLFGSTTTKGKSLTVRDASPVSHILIGRGLTKSINSNTDDPQAYVINFENNQGFAILADDKRLITNILAYSENGNINATTDNPGLLMFMGNIEPYLASDGARIKFIESIHAPTGDYSPNQNVTPRNFGDQKARCQYNWIYGGRDLAKPDEIIKYIAPLLTVEWGQDYPYNLECPVIAGKCAPAGCVAIAAVQIMSYYRWPQNINLNNTNYSINWNLALQKQIESANIHRLVRDFGNRVGMNYGSEGSEAYDRNVPAVMNYYGYTSAVMSSYNYPSAMTEIDNKRPVYMRGTEPNKTTGHAWVVDGYKYIRKYHTLVTDYLDERDIMNPVLVGQGVTYSPYDQCYLHYNWGWYGTKKGADDGYFLSIDFSQNQEIIKIKR